MLTTSIKCKARALIPQQWTAVFSFTKALRYTSPCSLSQLQNRTGRPGLILIAVDLKDHHGREGMYCCPSSDKPGHLTPQICSSFVILPNQLSFSCCLLTTTNPSLPPPLLKNTLI